MEEDREELLRQFKKAVKWDHDIQVVEGEFIEDVVIRFQKARTKLKKDELLQKILKNYQMFLRKWSPLLLPWHDNDMESVESVYNEVIWRSARRYTAKKGYKKKGKKFNAFLVSSLINRCRNDKTQKTSKRRHPTVPCVVCKEHVHQVDQKHLDHIVTLLRYHQTYKRYPLVSTDGNITCPLSSESVTEVTREYLNRVAGYYTIMDFEKEFFSSFPRMPVTCPVTHRPLQKITADYPPSIKHGYTQAQFVKDFPDFAGVIVCPFSGKKMLEMTQEHLDKVLKQKSKHRYTMAQYRQDFPNAPTRAKQAQVYNPYSKKWVKEITSEMLREAGTTMIVHLHKYAKYHLNKWYPDFVRCPFTGKRTHKITRKYLRKIHRTAFEFYSANCIYPLQQWQVKCGHCGEYVNNIWDHLEKARHTYAEPTTLETYLSKFGATSTKHTVTTNSFVENDEGDTMHLVEVLTQKKKGMDPIEFEDSLLKGAVDEFDRRLANVVAREAHTAEDIMHFAPVRKKFNIPPAVKSIRQFIKDKVGTDDFDLIPSDEKTVEVAIPGKDTVKQTLARLYKESDLDQTSV